MSSSPYVQPAGWRREMTYTLLGLTSIVPFFTVARTELSPGKNCCSIVTQRNVLLTCGFGVVKSIGDGSSSALSRGLQRLE